MRHSSRARPMAKLVICLLGLANGSAHAHVIDTFASCPAQGQTTTLNWPTSEPAGTYVVPGDFLGFGFETAFLDDYCTGSFSENLVNSVAKRVSQTLIIRIGGTSGDRVLFDPSLDKVKICVKGDCPVGSSATYILGPSYFKCFNQFQGQKMTIQAPLGKNVNITGSLDYVTRAYSALGASRVAGIALGNEPDLYSKTYSAQDYVNGALQVEKAIIQTLGLTGANAKIFEVPDLASKGSFTLPEVFEQGINSNGNVKYASEHYYQVGHDQTTYTAAALQADLMNHSAITSTLAGGYAKAQAYIEQNQPGVDYIISESGSALSGPPQSFADPFGAALWELDFNLYSMSIGIKRVDNTQRPAALHSLWVPDNSANKKSLGSEYNPGPQVRAPYFPMPMLIEFIGSNPGAVVEILGKDQMTAYAMFDPQSWTIMRMIIINLNYWSPQQKTARGSQSFTLPQASTTADITVQRLHAANGATAQGYDVDGKPGIITWAGETWSYKLDKGNGHFTGASKQEPAQVCGGSVVVQVPDSEAVMVTFPGGS